MKYHILYDSAIYQINCIKDAIDCARNRSPLYKLPHISDEIIAAHLAALRWNVSQHCFGCLASELATLQRTNEELLELLNSSSLPADIESFNKTQHPVQGQGNYPLYSTQISNIIQYEV
jgi:hypothetical protein